MRKCVKIWLIVAASLVLLGIFLFGGAMMSLRWDFRKLYTVQHETNHHEIAEDFSDITVNTDTADVTFIPSGNGKTEVTCVDEKNLAHSVTVKDGTLVIELVDTRKWYEYIGINIGSTAVTVSLPEGEYGALTVKSSTGDIEIPKDFSFESIDILGSTSDVDCDASVEGAMKIHLDTGDMEMKSLSAGALDLAVTTGKIEISGVTCVGDATVKVSTGKAYLTDVTCKNLTSSGNTGDLFLKNVIAAGKFSIERSTGDVSFDACDAAELFVVTDTGDVRGSLRSDKIFVTRTDTGRIDVPKSVIGGQCEITTDTGDIKIQISS